MINLDKDLNGSVLSFNHSTKLQFSTIICLNCTSPYIHRNQIKARFMTFFCHFHQQFSMMDCWDSQGWDKLLPTSHSAPSRMLECNCSVYPFLHGCATACTGTTHKSIILFSEKKKRRKNRYHVRQMQSDVHFAWFEEEPCLV